MTTKPITFQNTQESGQEQLSGASRSVINVVIDDRGTVRRRPGIQTYSGAPSTSIDSNGIDGIHATNGGVLYAVGGNDPSSGGPNRNIYRVTSGGADNLSSLSGTTRLVGSKRPVFAETEALLVIASGFLIQKVVLDTNVSSRLGGLPPEASHVTANFLRLEANDVTVDTTKVRYSATSIGTTDYSGHETWTLGGVGNAGFFTAEARPDPVVALAENTNELFVFGSTNLQVFGPDTQFVYSPVSTREYGCSAPYSVVKVDQSFAWLDHRRRFVVSDGREFQIIGGPIGADIDAMTTVSDCFGFRIHQDPVDCLVWVFPSEGRTYVYQQGAGWGQWQGQNLAGANWKALPINCHHHNHNDDSNLVGSPSGTIGELAMGVTNDLGTTMTSYAETGYFDRGTDNKKYCKAVHLVFRRGETTSSTDEPVGFLSYSNAPEEWSNPIAVGFGASGDREPVVTLRSLGTYRRRAWRFTFSGDVDLVLSRVTEEFEVLEV
jgi:hypothetical protein